MSLSKRAVHKNYNSALPYFGVISLSLFYPLNFVLDITTLGIKKKIVGTAELRYVEVVGTRKNTLT